MPSGFFYGGLAEGIDTAAKRNLAERSLEQEASLRDRALGVQERQIKRQEQNDAIGRADKQISDTMAVVGETIKSGLSVGRDPQAVLRAVGPLVQSAKQIATALGRDPAAIDAQVQALTLNPTGVETATAAGKAEGTKTATAQQTAESILSGGQSEGGFIIDPAKRGEAENKLRDDYQKRSQNFMVLRDFKDRIDAAPNTGAGDIQLVFSFMKVLDPASTVREGEFATASNAAGVPSSVMALYNKIVGGGRLDDKARTEIRGSADTIWQKASQRQSQLTNDFTAAAKRGGLNPKNVIIDTPDAPPMQKTPGGTSFRIIP